ncbi:hypothetical protein [Streptomyces marianii]|uniref:Uncharacterized protein n=1 Tax=Streptomyces marianii TaxID=1817406 RepID=A0A5R9DVN3_9ACTN|nr:hypothetical protein [Streptomyces marianii]TLQ39183.1 hypothetical protein FEF34_37920 [Streptomyces marianii]
MNRSLTRAVQQAVRLVPHGDDPFTHLVEVEHLFPSYAFSDAPARWTPGEGFTEVMGGAWIRDNADGTQTAVVTGVGPKQLPAADGGTWTEEEIWTVTSADPAVFAWLDDKPDRITWALGREDVEIVREPYQGHPAEAWETYWYRFSLENRFVPERRADGRYTLTLACAPNDGWDGFGPLSLADASSRVLATFGGRATVRTSVSSSTSGRVPHPVTLMRMLTRR